MNPTLPDEAVKAAQNAIRTTNWEYGITDADMAKALTAALPFLPVQVAVKKLEWTAAQNEAGRDGLWFIAIDLLGKKHEVIKSFNGQKGEGWTYGRGWFPALEAAKAAAQADYEARILSALEPSAARELALEEAAQVAEMFPECDLLNVNGNEVSPAVNDAFKRGAFAQGKAIAAAIRTLSSPDHADAGKVEGNGWAVSTPKFHRYPYFVENIGGKWCLCKHHGNGASHTISVHETASEARSAAPSQEVAGS